LDFQLIVILLFADIYDAKNAVDHLSGFNVCGRYLIVLYYQPSKMQQKIDTDKQRRELEEVKAKFGINKT
jgi:pre-mRNA branch site protein p14